MSDTFTIEAELAGVEAEIRDVNAEAMRIRPHDPRAALELLDQSERVVELVSVSRQGRFHNQRALALESLQEYDRAILEFDRAAYCFERSGEIELCGMVHNNIASVYSRLGNHARAHDSVDIAISLAVNPNWRAQWGDQKANIFLREGKFAEAEAELNKAQALLVDNEQLEILAEILSTRDRIAKQKHGTCGTLKSVLDPQPDIPNVSPKASRPQGDPMFANPLECVQHLLRSNYQAALPLCTLIAMVADPDGDPERYGAAYAAVQFLIGFTPRGEAEIQSVFDEFKGEPAQTSEASS